MIPFLDLKAAYEEISSEINEAVSRVLSSGWYIGGEEVRNFEAAWSGYCGAQHAVGVSNGLDALILALRACGIGPGDGVIVPSNTFIATWLAISAVGAKIQSVEPDPLTHNLNPTKIEAAITSTTRAIIPVHLYGQPADLDSILSIAKKHKLRVIEDAAQAHGAMYKGQRIGAQSDISCWSFYPGKNLGAMGDAGAVTTNDPDLATKVRLIGNYGSLEKYVHAVTGKNARMDPIQAAILDVKLKHLDNWTQRRKDIARLYTEQLSHPDITLPYVPSWAEPSWHLYVINTPRRDELQQHLKKQEIDTIIHYPIPPHEQRAYQCLSLKSPSFPIAQKASEQVLSLPIGPHLSLEAAKAVISAVNEF